ncbi:flagellar hook-basal body protein [Bacillus sp. FJAT-49736]|uniref:flagellar hook-basal body protein n=1 Tax=Bacillus sp. FJAT-49736 TaxID=2833582 RepID=UPI001BC9F9C1|nr:flagellar hook-basal body protein [Bacillus sp. FJAT-49736]MBS4175440.1 flagellar hook-basal body protein [Bacillus sp. FJAT-49736]
MLRGFYTAASGMIAQQRKTDLLTNNMANSNTPGFKVDQSSMRAFPELLLQRMNKQTVPVDNTFTIPSSSRVGAINTGVYMQEVLPKFLQGDLQATQNKTDLALQDINPDSASTVFFSVQDKDGKVKYTRNGNFTLDGEGYLTTANGLYVLGRNGNRIHLNSADFSVDSSGRVSENGTQAGTLGIAYAANPNTLIKEGDGLFRVDNNTVLPTAPNTLFQVKQGYLERSNVDVSQTMTEMLSAYRSFEANQKVLQAYDHSMDKAVNEVGRVNG